MKKQTWMIGGSGYAYIQNQHKVKERSLQIKEDVIDYSKEYFTIEALEDGLTATFNMTEGNESVEYCIDNGDWVSISSGEETPSINQGQMIAFKGTLTPVYYHKDDIYGIGTFSISKECNLKGNCMSLLFGDDAKNNDSLEGFDAAFCTLFYGCTTIKNVDSKFLPATTLYFDCYAHMFENCTSLVTAPELPATMLHRDCYAYMFKGCTSLTTAPELPATELIYECYLGMFEGCTNLSEITMLATNITADNCLTNWVDGVASDGTFIKHPKMNSLPTGNSGIPSGWTVEDYQE